MQTRQLSIEGAVEFTPKQHGDSRGLLLEWFRSDALAASIGHDLALAQGNLSISARGVVRGIHYASVPPGQAKYVTCISGAVRDVVVDLRVGSPTFGMWDSVLLDETDRRAVYAAEGLGHAFLALSDQATLLYLCSEGYAPEREHGVHPLDPALGIEWPADVTPRLSAKDGDAPTLEAAMDAGLLPSYDECMTFYAGLRTG